MAPANPLDESGLCLLSLDGGGVRGLSSLYILKSIMDLLNHEREGRTPLKPCDVFDLIAGTSTGGLIAIMLGRLNMNVDECISSYTELMQEVFAAKRSRFPFKWSGKTQSRFSSKRLRKAIEKVVVKAGASTTDLLNDGVNRKCRMFVCAAAKETTGTTRLRSYRLSDELDIIPATICDAALATSAASTFFDSVQIGNRKFVDGAIGANNPVEEVEDEASNIWRPQNGVLQPLVKCFISIGTGDPGRKAIDDNMFKFLKTLVRMVTDTSRTAEKFAARWRWHFEQKRAFRFNVDHGLQEVGLAEYDKKGTIEAATDKYLRSQTQKSQVSDCVRNLKSKQSKATNVLATLISGYNAQSIASRSRRSLTSASTCSWIPLGRNLRFVGRDSEIEQLEAKLCWNDFCERVAIIGLGGIGKTQIVLEFAYRLQKNMPNCSVFWIPAVSIETLTAAYLEVGRLLRIPGVDDQGADALKLVQDHLNQESSGCWILIFDNADDIDMWINDKDSSTDSRRLIDYLPNSSNGSILFTTRSKKAAVSLAKQNTIEVTEMDDKLGKELLMKSLIQNPSSGDDKLVLELLDRLTHLPLAIIQAAAFINENSISISDYLDILQGQEEKEIIEVLSRDFEDEGRYRSLKNPIATTWLISFAQIEKRDPLAAEYLKFMACVQPKAIPLSLLPSAPSSTKSLEAIGTLMAYSFITRKPSEQLVTVETREENANEPADAIFDIHRLVHLAMRNWLRKEDNLAAQTHKVVTRLERVFPRHSSRHRRLCRAYFPHARYILDSPEFELVANTEEAKLSLLHVSSNYLYNNGKMHESVKLRLKELGLRTAVFGAEKSATLMSMRNLAKSYCAQHKYNEAEVLLKKVLEVSERIKGGNHADTLHTMTDLSLVYLYQGRLQEAEELLVQNLAVSERVLGPKHSTTIRGIGRLSRIYLAQGRLEEADKLANKELDGRRASGMSSTGTFLALYSQGEIWKMQGRDEEALAIMGECVDWCKRCTDPNSSRRENAEMTLKRWQNPRKTRKIHAIQDD